MQTATLELMREQVHAIYRVVTGNDLVEPDSPPEESEGESQVDVDQVVRRFADLEALARTLPAVVQRVPPFNFVPSIDMLEAERELVIEVALPGVQRADVSVERTQGGLIITGFRRGEHTAAGKDYLLAEIPRGPFHRVISIPHGLASEPRVEMAEGLLTIRLRRELPRQGRADDTSEPRS